MNRIDEKFESLRKENKKALSAFLTMGDPDIEVSKMAMKAMQSEGVDIIDIGVPFSDPAADGPVIQVADERAISNGTDIFSVFEAVSEVRGEIEIPMVLHLYYNVILQYGAEEFFKKCSEVGIDGILVPDLPYEENDDIDTYAEKYGIYKINYITPTNAERTKEIAENSKGYLYCVSSKSDIDYTAFTSKIREFSSVPLMAGYNIANAVDAKKYAEYFDGAITANAVVEAIAEGDSIANLENVLRDIKSGL